MRTLFPCLLCLLLLPTACSTTLSNMTPAKAYEPGEIQVVAAMALQGNSNLAASVVDAAQGPSDEFGSDGTISEQEFDRWITNIATFTLFRPAITPEIMLRFGLTDKILEGMDLGIKTNFSAYKIDLKTQLWESLDAASALSLSLGYTYNSDLVASAVSFITFTDFTRHDLTTHLAWGREFGDIGRISLGPHLVASLVNAEQNLPDQIEGRLSDEARANNPNVFFNNELILYAGANAMGMIGYKHVFLVLDLSLHWMRFQPEIFGDTRDLDGLSVSLGGGLSLSVAL